MNDPHIHTWATQMGPFFEDGVTVEACEGCHAMRTLCTQANCPKYINPEYAHYVDGSPVCDAHQLITNG